MCLDGFLNFAMEDELSLVVFHIDSDDSHEDDFAVVSQMKTRINLQLKCIHFKDLKLAYNLVEEYIVVIVL